MRCYGVDRFFTESQMLTLRQKRAHRDILGKVITPDDVIYITRFDDREPHRLNMLASYDKIKRITYTYREEGSLVEPEKCISRIKCGRVIESIHYPYIYKNEDFFEYVTDDIV